MGTFLAFSMLTATDLKTSTDCTATDLVMSETRASASSKQPLAFPYSRPRKTVREVKLLTLILVQESLQHSVNLLPSQVIHFLILSPGFQGGVLPGAGPHLTAPLWCHLFSP